MTSMRCRLTGVALALLLLGFPASALSSGGERMTKPEVSVTPESSTVVLGQPILVDVVIENHSTQVWTVDWGGYRSNNITLNVSDLISNRALETAATRAPSFGDGFTVSGRVALESNGRTHRTLVLDSWFDFDEVGKYGVLMTIPVESEQPSVRDILEVRFEVEVLDPDSEALAKACTELADTAIDGTMEAGHRAGEALSHVRDEACLPSLARVLAERSFVKNDVVTALAEIGAEQAVSVLVAQWEDLSDGVKAWAHYEFSIRDRLRQLETALAAEGLSFTGEPN